MNALHNEGDAEDLAVSAMDRLLGLTATLADITDRGMAALGLTRARAQLLWQLGRTGPVTQRELAEALRVTPRNVTGLLDALAESGLVLRERHPKDRRATLVRLTEAGERLNTMMRNGRREWAQGLFADVAESELRSFADLLDRLHATLRPQLESAASEAGRQLREAGSGDTGDTGDTGDSGER